MDSWLAGKKRRLSSSIQDGLLKDFIPVATATSECLPHRTSAAITDTVDVCEVFSIEVALVDIDSISGEIDLAVDRAAFISCGHSFLVESQSLVILVGQRC